MGSSRALIKHAAAGLASVLGSTFSLECSGKTARGHFSTCLIYADVEIGTRDLANCHPKSGSPKIIDAVVAVQLLADQLIS